MAKRNDYISWDEYFMGVAVLSSMRSKDPSTQVGACIVSPEHKIIGVGYNGFPRGCSDDELPWEREGAWEDTKYPYVCHAELNAILNSTLTHLEGATLYVALFPCNECAKAIIQTGIKRVVFMSNKYEGSKEVNASRRMMESAGIKLEQFRSDRTSITLDFNVD